MAAPVPAAGVKRTTRTAAQAVSGTEPVNEVPKKLNMQKALNASSQLRR